MKKIISLCLLLGTSIAAADIVRSPIHAIEKENETYLIKFANGRVAFTNEDLGSVEEGAVVEAKVDEKQKLISIRTLKVAPENHKSLNLLHEYNPPPFEPTVLPNYEAAIALFNRLNPNYKRSSECSNRAHVWAHEEFKKNGLKSLKVFAFFTRSYIQRVGLKWWFHVAPAVLVQEGDKVETRVLNFMFNRRPLTTKEWTDQFVFSKRACKPTNRFSEHWVSDQSLDCYLTTDTMYNWMPEDLRLQEAENRYKTQFYMNQVNAAYSEAF